MGDNCNLEHLAKRCVVVVLIRRAFALFAGRGNYSEETEGLENGKTEKGSSCVGEIPKRRMAGAATNQNSSRTFPFDFKTGQLL